MYQHQRMCAYVREGYALGPFINYVMHSGLMGSTLVRHRERFRFSSWCFYK